MYVQCCAYPLDACAMLCAYSLDACAMLCIFTRRMCNVVHYLMHEHSCAYPLDVLAMLSTSLDSCTKSCTTFGVCTLYNVLYIHLMYVQSAYSLDLCATLCIFT